MKYLRKLFEKLSENRIARNIVLIICSVIIFCFVIYILLDVFTRHNKYKTVLDFVGTGISEARQMADKDRLRIEISDSLFVPAYEGGVILEQQPAAGGKVKSGRRIFVTVNSFRQKMVKVPYVTGYSLRQAKNILEVAGLEIAELKYVDDIATNYVLDEQYEGKTINASTDMQLEIGSGITLVVGRNSEQSTVEIPKLIGLSLADAKSRLWDRGLNVGGVRFEDGINLLNRKNARVLSQSPAYGNNTTLGASVSIALSLDEEKIEKNSKSADREAEKIIQQKQEEDRTVDAIIEALETETPSELFE